MRPSDDNIVTVDTLLGGYRAALQRFREASKSQDAQEAFWPLFESLNWAVTLDDRIGAHWAPEGKPLHEAWRARISDAEPLRGLRWARNRVHHDWTDALYLDNGGFSFPMTFPLVFFEWRWRDASELPAEGRSDPAGKATYIEMLAGSPARQSLDQLLDAFERVTDVLEPVSWTTAE